MRRALEYRIGQSINLRGGVKFPTGGRDIETFALRS